jgi:hypothetical protein
MSKEQMEQDKEIREARKRLKPTRVKSRHVPAWLRSRLLKLKREGKLPTARKWPNNYELLMAAEKAAGCVHLFDHWGSTQRNGKIVLVSEPYGPCVKSVVKLADFLGVECSIEANSWHYPGCTVRVVYYPHEHNKEQS